MRSKMFLSLVSMKACAASVMRGMAATYSEQQDGGQLVEALAKREADLARAVDQIVHREALRQ